MITDPNIVKHARQALVKLGEQAPAQAEVTLRQLTPAELLAAHSCDQEGDKLRLITLLEHVSTRQHLEADLMGYLQSQEKAVPKAATEAGPEDDTDLDEPTV